MGDDGWSVRSVAFCFCFYFSMSSARYLTDLNSLKINSDAEVGDIEKVSQCLPLCCNTAWVSNRGGKWEGGALG